MCMYVYVLYAYIHRYLQFSQASYHSLEVWTHINHSHSNSTDYGSRREFVRTLTLRIWKMITDSEGSHCTGSRILFLCRVPCLLEGPVWTWGYGSRRLFYLSFGGSESALNLRKDLKYRFWEYLFYRVELNVLVKEPHPSYKALWTLSLK